MIKIKSSKIQGVGVFSDVDIKAGEQFHSNIALVIPNNILSETELEDYVIPSNWSHQSLIALGETSFLNDGSAKANVRVESEYDEELEHVFIKLYAITDIKAGIELTLDYENVTGEEEEDES